MLSLKVSDLTNAQTYQILSAAVAPRPICLHLLLIKMECKLKSV